MATEVDILYGGSDTSPSAWIWGLDTSACADVIGGAIGLSSGEVSVTILQTERPKICPDVEFVISSADVPSPKERAQLERRLVEELRPLLPEDRIHMVRVLP